MTVQPPPPPASMQFPPAWYQTSDAWINGPFVVERDEYPSMIGVQANLVDNEDGTGRVLEFWNGDRVIMVPISGQPAVDGDTIRIPKGIRLRAVTLADMTDGQRQNREAPQIPLWASVQDGLSGGYWIYSTTLIKKRDSWLRDLLADAEVEEDLPDDWFPANWPYPASREAH
jgi:hypothetical protein